MTSDDDLHARHLSELEDLRDAVAELGYVGRIIERSSTMPYHTLLVDLAPAGPAEPVRQLALNFYPLADEEFAGTLFLQYYVPLPVEPSAGTRAAVLELLADINNRLVLGHVGLTAGVSQAHFRYVQPLPADELISAEKVGDVLVLVTYSTQLFEGALLGVADGSLTLEAARDQLAAAYA